MRLPGFPRKILLIPSQNIHIEVTEALRLVATRRAHEVYVNGEFQGIELGHFGPAPSSEPHAEPLPAAELPGIIFRAPHPDYTHKLIMQMVYSGDPVAQFA